MPLRRVAGLDAARRFIAFSSIPNQERNGGQAVPNFYKLLMFLSRGHGGAFGTVLLGAVAREVHWEIGGWMPMRAGAIAAALFLALPGTLQHGDHYPRRCC